MMSPGIRSITNADLRPEDIPAPDADWREIARLALSYSGYREAGSFQDCASIANSRLDSTLKELRCCLFFEQRRWRHFGYDPDEETMAYIRVLVEKIRSKVQAGDTSE